VYLPGAGWRGFDPSGSGALDDRYITLATSSRPPLTAAVTGTFSGPPATKSDMQWSITADLLEQTHIRADSLEVLQS
jgi:transglutaminase-like putative cysteine protease